jgi:hypothetical protein
MELDEMKKNVLVFMLVLLSSSFNLQAFSLLDMGFQTRAAGLGEAFSALCDDSSAIYYNPALLNAPSGQQFSFGYSSLYSMANIFSFSYVLPGLKNWPRFFPEIGISAGVSLLRDGGVQSYTAPALGNPGDFLKGVESGYSENLFMLGLGVQLNDSDTARISTGLTLKFFDRKFLDFYTYGLGADFGLSLRHTFFNFSTVLRNISTGSLGAANEPLPLSLRFGSLIKVMDIIKGLERAREKRPGVMVFDVPVGYLNYEINPVVDCEITFDSPVRVDVFAGLEAWLNNVAALRVGYNTINGLSFGGSIQFTRIRLDYTYLMHPELDESHKLTGTFYFQ